MESILRIFFKHYFLVLNSMVVALIGVILVANPDYLPSFSQSVTASYLDNIKQGKYGTGVYTGSINQLDFSLLEPGDILLGGKPGGAYGHFTHAGLYLGRGQVLEGYVDCGISRQAVEHYHDYDWACILRVELPESERRQAVRYACQQEFKPFYPAAFKTGERYWNCTKLIWAAYREQGIDLDSRQDLWVTPDAIFYSPYIRVIASEGKMP